jgi:hypothetical protein
MKLELSSVGNPDFGQNPNEPLWGCPIRNAVVEISSFEHASMLCEQFIEINNLGGGNWSGGLITDDKGEKLAFVSYNGRVWKITKDAPRYSGKNEDIKLDFEKNKIEKATFKLYKHVENRFAYQDDKGRLIVLKGNEYSEMLKQYMTFNMLTGTHKDFQSTYMLDLFVDRWSLAGIVDKVEMPEKVEFYL